MSLYLRRNGLAGSSNPPQPKCPTRQPFGMSRDFICNARSNRQYARHLSPCRPYFVWINSASSCKRAKAQAAPFGPSAEFDDARPRHPLRPARRASRADRKRPERPAHSAHRPTPQPATSNQQPAIRHPPSAIRHPQAASSQRRRTRAAARGQPWDQHTVAQRTTSAAGLGGGYNPPSCGRNSMVECQPSMLNVASSSLVVRFRL